MRVREPVGGRGWLLTDLTCGFWNVVWQATKQDACHATGTGPQRGHSLNHQYGLQLMIEQSPQSAMETDSYPKFHNEAGAPIVRIGWREFKCIATMPPQDHPHVYLNMGNANEIVCPYCASLFRFDPSLGAREAEPASCGYSDADFEAWAPQVQTTA